MNNNLKTIIALALGIAGGGAATYFSVKHPAEAPAGDTMATNAQEAEKKVLYWYDPMVPDQHFDKPGKSPFMDMDLVPKYAGDAGDDGETVVIDGRIMQNLGIRSADVETDRLWRRIDTVGYVATDENRIEAVQSRANGYVERLHVHAVNDPVKAGQILAEIYSPELVAAQEEYRLFLKSESDPAWLSAARSKLKLLGISDSQIASLEKGGRAARTIAYRAPFNGVASAVNVHEGSAVSAGMPMLMIANLSRVWVVAEVPENQANWISIGRPVDVNVSSMPGKVFEGKVEYLYPELNRQARTLRVRIKLDNPGLELKPGMYANVVLYGGASEEAILVPTEAVITTGQRSMVIVDEGNGRFRPVLVKTGIENYGKTQILSGLSGGERVVVSGQFLIESEANLKGVIDRLSGGADIHKGTGKVTGVNAATGELEMEHDPIPSLDWPSMTMGFNVRDKSILQPLKVGDAVTFDLQKEGGDFYVVGIRRVDAKGDKP